MIIWDSAANAKNCTKTLTSYFKSRESRKILTCCFFCGAGCKTMDPPNDHQASAEYYKARRPISDVSGFPESLSREIDLEIIHRDLEIMSSPFQQASQAELPDTPTQLHPAGSADIPSHALRFSSDSRVSSDYGFYSGSNSLEDTPSGNSGRGYVSDTAGTIALSGSK
jgi:hypothetical protein